MDLVPARSRRIAFTTSTAVGARPVRDELSQSFEDVYRAHHRDVARFVYLSTRGRDDADEITSETFARAFAAWRDGRGPAGRPLPWLLVIARRIATDRARRRRLIAWLPLPGSREHGSSVAERGSLPEPGTEDANAAAREFWLWLDALCRALPPRQREVLFLRYQRDLTDADIGEVLQLSASGVRTLAARALAALRKHPELWS